MVYLHRRFLRPTRKLIYVVFYSPPDGPSAHEATESHGRATAALGLRVPSSATGGPEGPRAPKAYGGPWAPPSATGGPARTLVLQRKQRITDDNDHKGM